MGKFPKWGWWGWVGKNTHKKVPISIWEFWKPRRGVSILQKCLNYKRLLDSIQKRRITRLSFEVFSLGKTLDFLDQNCFSDQHFFLTNFFFLTNIFFGPMFFFRTKFFRTKIVFGTNFFRTKNFFAPKFFFGPIIFLN